MIVFFTLIALAVTILIYFVVKTVAAYRERAAEITTPDPGPTGFTGTRRAHDARRRSRGFRRGLSHPR